MTNNSTTFEEYYILHKIGSGSFGQVYLGENKKKGSHRAIKLIRSQRKSEQEKFCREASIMRTLSGHPNIVRCYDARITNHGLMYLVLEFLPDGDLLQTMKKGEPFEERTVVTMIRSLLRATAFMHAKFIVHRDIKLENILLSNIGGIPIVKLSDFGLARLDFHNSLTGAAGSPCYIAPEEYRNEPYGRPVDIWALGVLTYALLVAELPFQKDENLKNNILQGNYTMEGIQWDRISRVAKNFIRSLLIMDPDLRPTAEEALHHSWFQIKPTMFPSTTTSLSSSSFTTSSTTTIMTRHETNEQDTVLNLLNLSANSEDCEMDCFSEEYEMVEDKLLRRKCKQQQQQHHGSNKKQARSTTTRGGKTISKAIEKPRPDNR